MSIKGIFPIDKWDFKSESILKDLPLNDLELLTAHKSEQVYKKGEIIFREGAYPSGIFYITLGKVKKYKVNKEGERANHLRCQYRRINRIPCYTC